MRAIAEHDQPPANLNDGSVDFHRLSGRYDVRRLAGNRAGLLDDGASGNALADFESPHGIFGNGKIAINRDTLERHAFPRHHTREFAEDVRLVTHAVRLEVAQHEPIRGNRDTRRRTPQVHVEISRGRNRTLKLGGHSRRQLLSHDPRDRQFQRETRIGLNQSLKYRASR